MKKRASKISAVSAAVMLSAMALVSGCGTTTGTQPLTGSQNNSGKPVEITFWEGTGGQLGEVLKSEVNEFNQSQKQVHVNVVFQQSYDATGQKLQAAIASGSVPDVVQLNTRSWQSFAQAGALLPLDTYIQNDQSFNFSDFEKGLLVNTALDGKQYTIPFNRSTPILYFNKDIIKQIGLDPNNPVTTWAQLQEAAKKATITQNGKTQQFGFAASMSGWYFYSLVWSNGGSILSQDNKTVTFGQPEAAKGLQLWSDMINKDKTMMPPTGGTSTSGSSLGDSLQQAFVNGKVAFYIDSTGSLGSLSNSVKFDLGAAFLPKFQEYAVPTGGANLAIMAKTSKAKQDAAWKFVEFMTNQKQAINWAEKTGYLPIRVSAANSPELQQYYTQHPLYKVALEQLQYAKAVPSVPQIKQIETAINNAMEKTVVNNSSAETELKAAADQIQPLMK